MPELDDAALERRLRGVLEEHLGALPLDLTVDALERRREAKGVAPRFGRGRRITLVAAAAVLLGGGALAAGSGLLRLPTVVPPVPEPSVIAVATTSPDATSPSPSESAAPSASPIPVAGPGGVWIPTGSMVTPRSNHTAVRLQDGRVLVVGGWSDSDGSLTSVELYDPATGTWSATGSISKPLFGNAMLLRDGKVLVLVEDVGGYRRSGEVYDPARGTWTATGPMVGGADKSGRTLTVLRDGRVLVGGLDGAQVYDPAGGTWTATGPMVGDSGFRDTVTVLRDGRVLVAGGDGAEVYDPASGTWTATGKKNGVGRNPVAALLSDGKVLVAGGHTDPDYYGLDSADVFDPVTASWTAIANMHAKTTATPTAAFLQPDGKVLVVEPYSAEVYDPATGTWTALPVTPGMAYLDAALLSDGAVLVTGVGAPGCTAADLYDPHTGSWTTASTMLGCSRARSFTLLLDGTVLVAGGDYCNDTMCVSTDTAELYVPAGVSPPPLAAFPNPPPAVLPSPTPRPTP